MDVMEILSKVMAIVSPISILIACRQTKKLMDLQDACEKLISGLKKNNLCTVQKSKYSTIDNCDVCNEIIYLHHNYCSGCGCYIVKVKDK